MGTTLDGYKHRCDRCGKRVHTSTGIQPEGWFHLVRIHIVPVELFGDLSLPPRLRNPLWCDVCITSFRLWMTSILHSKLADDD